jgi:predicted  nucleic acid-binding Zn-ribbon protein
MSEYQYYEFQAIDRPLSDRQMRELRAISGRATISRTRFNNYYTFGDLKENPRDLLIRYFDASLSFAHWFYVELAFRFPKTTVDVRELRRYAAGQSLNVHSTGGDVVVAVAVERDDFDPEDDGQGWLSSLTAIRADIAGGDARALYFAWLLDVQSGEIEDDVVEPARPDGLGSLSPALESFIEIMGLDRDMVVAAAEGTRQTAAVPPVREIGRWMATLDEREKVALLTRVARGETDVVAELMRRARRQASGREATRTLRTAGALRARAERLREQRRQIRLSREAKVRARREREQAAARDRHLSMLAQRQADAWRRVEALVVKRPGDYDAAVTLLLDLREIGEREGRRGEVTERIRALREVHAKKPSFLARLKKAGL